ncbi:MAG: DUF5362 domain-containing protein [FCB group bacterium]|nr:DUF5362 domain-containing protein [FCB group bacterium]
MTDHNETLPQDENYLLFPLDPRGLEILTKLARWSNFVGVINIIAGIFQILAIFIYYDRVLLIIPTLSIGGFLIYLGTRLTSTAAHLRYGAHHKDSQSFLAALDLLRTYIFLTGIVYLFTLLMIIGILLFTLLLGAAASEFII